MQNFKLTSNFTLNDYLVIMAGTNDLLSNTPINWSLLYNTLNNTQNTNTILIGTLFQDHKPFYNDNVFKLNTLMNDVSQMYTNSTFVEPNVLISRNDITGYGLHLKKSGKFKIFKQVVNYITSKRNFIHNKQNNELDKINNYHQLSLNSQTLFKEILPSQSCGLNNIEINNTKTASKNPFLEKTIQIKTH